ncbi:MAG: HAD family hydrolase [archaeon]
MVSKTIKAIIFDMQEVIYKGSLGKAFACKLSDKYNIPFDKIRKVYAETFDGYMTGKESEHDFLKKFVSKLGITFNYKLLSGLFLSAFEEVCSPDKEIIDLIKNLHGKYDLFIASDHYKEPIEFMHNKYDIGKYFKGMLFSYQLGYRKTSERFFDKILENYAPGECVFIDDTERYIDLGNKIGFHSILFKNNNQLIRELNKLGIKK